MKNLIEKTKQMYQKSFTLIELIVVIVVIGILAAIVIPNISSFKEEASVTAMVADGRNLQTAIDLYQLDYHGDFPTLSGAGDSTKPVLGVPHSVDFNALYPAYIRDLPQAKEMYYWIDYQGQFYYSTIDNPNDFIQGDSGLTWTANEKASGYSIYEIESNITGSSKNSSLNVIGELSGDTNSFTPDGYSKENQYFIQVVDEYKLEAPPVTSDYEGVTPFAPERFVKEVIPMTPEQEDLINGPNIKVVVAGGLHSLVLDNEGNLWSFGTNRYGELGHTVNIGTNIPNPIPKKIMTNVKFVSANVSATLVVKENGELWSFGRNYHGQLGHTINNGTNNPTEPKQIMTGVESVAIGSAHTLAIKENGELWSFGLNKYGQLGYTTNNGNDNPNPTPKFVMSGAKYVAAGAQFTHVVKEDNSLWSFGLNSRGTLGYSLNSGTYNANPIPKQVMVGVDSISLSDSHVLVINISNELFSFGLNQWGQLGHTTHNGNALPNPLPRLIMTDVKSASGGYSHSLAVKQNGELWSFGINQFGELGHATNNGTGTANPIPQLVLEGVSHVSAGKQHSLVLTSEGSILSFGRNTDGQLGYPKNIGNIIPNPTPEEIYLPIE